MRWWWGGCSAYPAQGVGSASRGGHVAGVRLGGCAAEVAVLYLDGGSFVSAGGTVVDLCTSSCSSTYNGGISAFTIPRDVSDNPTIGHLPTRRAQERWEGCRVMAAGLLVLGKYRRAQHARWLCCITQGGYNAYIRPVTMAV